MTGHTARPRPGPRRAQGEAMTVPQFLAYLRRRGVEIRVEDGRPRVRAATGALTPQLRAEIAARRADVVEFFRSVGAAGTVPPLAGRGEGQDLPLSSGQQRLWL